MINRDWTVQVQFDGSKVLQGFRKIDDMYKRVARSAMSTEDKKNRQIEKAYAQRAREVEREQKQQARLDKKLHDRKVSQINKIKSDEQKAYAEKARLENRAIAEQQAKERRRQAIIARSNREAHQQATFDKARNREQIRIQNQMNRLENLNNRGGFKTVDDKAAYQAQMQALAMRKQATAAAMTRTELVRLAQVNDNVVASQDRLIRKARQVSNALSMQQKVVRGMRNSLSHMATSYLSVFAAAAGARAFYRTGREFQSMEAALLGASGSAELAAQNMKFLENTSLKLGISLTAGVSGFNKLGIAARSQGYPLEEIRRIYTSIAEASTAFGLNAPRQNLVFLATSQMISKAKVSAEELRRQLGDNMPIAIEAMRRAYSDFKGEFVDISEFTKMMESGKIMSKDVMGSFAKHMSEMAREGGALNAAMTKLLAQEQRSIAAMQLAIKETFGDSTILNLFTSSWRDIQIMFEETVPLFKALGLVMGVAFKTVTTVLKVAIPLLKIFGSAIFNLTYPFRIMSDVVKKMEEGKEKLTDFERSILRFTLTIQRMQLAVMKAYLWLLELGDSLEVKGDDSMGVKMAKGFGSWAIAIMGTVAAFKTFGAVLGWLFKGPLKLLGWLLGMGGGAKAAGGMGKILKSVFTSGGAKGAMIAGAKGLAGTFAMVFKRTLVGALTLIIAETWGSVITGNRSMVNDLLESGLGNDNFTKMQDWIGRYISLQTAAFSATSRGNLASDYRSWRGKENTGSTVTNHVEIKIDNAKEDVTTAINKAFSRMTLF